MKERSNWDIILKNETQEYAKCNFTVKKIYGCSWWSLKNEVIIFPIIIFIYFANIYLTSSCQSLS